MDSATVYINKSYFRRATGSLITWPLDQNYCRVRITVKTHRNKLSATLHIVADLASTNVSIFDRPTLRRSIPLGSLRETALCSRRRGENYSTIVHCLTLRRQTNPLLSGAVVNLYQESRLEIDKIYSGLTALRQPLSLHCLVLDTQSKARGHSTDRISSWIVRLLNNLTVQSLGLCPDYLYVLHVAQEFFEIQDVNQACILSCQMSRIANCTSLNGWFFVQFTGCLSDADSIDSPDGGYLAMQCPKSGQILQLFKRLLGLSFGHRHWPSAPCLDQAPRPSSSEAFGLSPRREASFNAHRPRSATNRRRLIASPSSPSPSPSASPSPMASPRRLVGRFSFFRRHHQQQQQQQQKPSRSPSSLSPQLHQQRLQLPQERPSYSQLGRHQSSSSVLSFSEAQSEQLEDHLTSSSAATSSSSVSDSSSSCRFAASVASLSALDGRRGNASASSKRRRRQFQQSQSAQRRSHKRLLSNEAN